MPVANNLTTTISTKGHVLLPKAIRRRRRWGAGTQLVVEDTTEGVLLSQAFLFPETKPADVFASLRYRGAPRSVEEMTVGIVAGAKRRHAR